MSPKDYPNPEVTAPMLKKASRLIHWEIQNQANPFTDGMTAAGGGKPNFWWWVATHTVHMSRMVNGAGKEQKLVKFLQHVSANCCQKCAT